MKKAVLSLVFILNSLTHWSMAQTMMPIPSQNGDYAGTRGYWFIAPTNFIITGLRVPTDASNNAQSIEVLKLHSVANVDHSNFTSLAYFQNVNNTNVIATNIVVQSGDTIAILGTRGTITSYGPGNYASNIGGKPITLYRINSSNGHLSNGQVSVVRPFANFQIGRIEMYYVENTNTWDGISWSKGSSPDNSQIVILNSSTSPGSFEALDLNMDAGIDLNLLSTDTVKIAGNINGIASTNGKGTLNNMALSGNSSNWIGGAGGAFSGTGTPANGLNFDGSDDYASVSDNSSFDFSSGLTAEAWVKPDNLNSHASLVSKFANGQREFSLLLLSSGVMEYSITFNGSSEQYFGGNTTLSAGNWYHIALTFDGTTMRAYVNGNSDGSTLASGTIHNGTSDLYIGARSEGNLSRYFDGTLDEVRIWNTTRSQADIQNDMNNELNGNETGLVAYYNFNQGTAGGNNSGETTLENNKVVTYDPNVISGKGTLIFDNSGETLNLDNVKINMEGVVEVTSGTTLQTNDSLTLIASSASSYGQIIGDGAVLGNVTSQAWMDVASARYHYLGSPFTNATLEEFNEGQTMVAANSGQGTVWQWDADNASWAAPSSLTGVAINGRGYAVYAGTNAYGTFLMSGNGVSELDGTVAQGDINVALGYNDGQAASVSFVGGSGQSSTEGWNFLANPYPSQYDWNGQSLPSGMSNAFYVNASSGYASYVSGVGTNGGTRYLAPFQGFWVQTSNSSPGNFTFEQDQRLTAPSTSLMKTSPIDGVWLSVSDSSVSDELFIGFDNQATSGFDTYLDARKLLNKNDIPNLYTTDKREAFSINRVAAATQTSFPLTLDNVADGRLLSFSLEADQLSSYNSVTLEDKMLNIMYDLKASHYSFRHNESYGSNRFVLHFSSSAVGQVELPVLQ
ncbi:MAG: LamG domain-containing protein, partial [Owenweeksia sp.]